MAAFVGAHRVHHGARGRVGGGQTVQVPGQMLFHLAFCFHHKTQAHGVAGPAGQQPDAKGTGVPQGVQPAGAAAQGVQRLQQEGRLADPWLAGRGMVFLDLAKVKQ